MTWPFEFANRLSPVPRVTDEGAVAALIFESVESAEEGGTEQHSQHEAELSVRIVALEQQLRTQVAALGPQLDDVRRTTHTATRAEAEREFAERLARESVDCAP